MRKVLLATSAVWLLASMAWAQVALAQSDTPSQAEIEAQIRKCMDEYGGSVLQDGLPSARYIQGEWHCIEPRALGSATNASAIFGWMMFIMLWSLIPMAVAASVAIARGESVVVALLLTIALGWIGLLIVLIGMRRSGQQISQALSSGPVEWSSKPHERLRVLEQLLADGSITQSEHDERRREILAQI